MTASPAPPESPVPRSDRPPAWRAPWLKAVLRYAAGFALLGLLARSGRLDPTVLRGIPVWGWASVVPIYLLTFFIGAIRWGLLVRAAGLRPRWTGIARLTMVGVWFSSVLPGGAVVGGDAARAAILAAESPGQRMRGAVSVLVDRLSGLVAIMLIGLAVLALNARLLANSPWLRVVAWGMAWVVIAVFLVVAISWSERIDRGLRRVPVVRTIVSAGAVRRFRDALAAYKAAPAALAAAVGLSVIGHAAMITANRLLFAGLAPESAAANPLSVVFAITVGMVSSTIPISGPGGIGMGNLGFDFAFAQVGLTGGAELALAWQISFLTVSQLGLPFFLLGRATGRRAGPPSAGPDGGQT